MAKFKLRAKKVAHGTTRTNSYSMTLVVSDGQRKGSVIMAEYLRSNIEAACIRINNAAEDLGCEVEFTGPWTQHEKKGPWSVNKAMGEE